MQYLFSDPVSKVPLVGPSYAKRLEYLGIHTIKDLLFYLPFRHDDFSLVTKISSVQEGETVTIQGQVQDIKNHFTKGGFVLQNAKISDETGQIEAVWFNQRFLLNAIHKDDIVSLSGKIKRMGKKLQISSPKYEVIRSTETTHTGRLVPIYSETMGLTSKWIRSRIKFLLDEIPSKRFLVEDPLDQNTRDKYALMPLSTALVQIHFPNSLDLAEKARERLSFDEMLISHLQAQYRKSEWDKKTVGNILEIEKHRDTIKKFVTSLPFQLTNSQTRVVEEVFSDLGKPTPMNRLVQGDVGSGKTVVAALAMLASHLNGYQSALMAPTEILALQHFQTISKLMTSFGISVGVATGSQKDYLDKDIIVGTHALLTESLNFKKLGLVVIDEQHKFGVKQRAKLTDKGNNPHVLTMTATPIPRTIALTLFKDLEMSVIDELPKERLPIKTWVVPKTKRDDAYRWIRDQKTQSFIVCPFIEESESMTTVKAVKTEFERLSKEVFPDLKLDLLHGQMKPKMKDEIMDRFRKAKTDILVSTPVVEVGVDIPNASIMLIEAAERFGLAQLHQLRGRVGRGQKQSYCLLFTESDNPNDVRRLKFLETLNSGLKLAEADLKYRGPGQRYGLEQHGKWDLKIADFNNIELIDKTNEFANIVLKEPESFPSLRKTLEESKIGVTLN